MVAVRASSRRWQRLTPWLPLAALGLGAAGVGFGGYVYLVPWREVQLELKRRTGELRSARNQAAAQATELKRLQREMAEIYAARRTAEESRRQTEMRVLQAKLGARLEGAKVSVQAQRRTLRVRFPEDSLFDARGPMLTREGQAWLQTVAELAKAHASQVRVSAPMAGALPPKWARAEYPKAADLSTARARIVLRALLRAGLSSDLAFAVVGGDGPSENAPEPALDMEIEPKI